MSNTRPANDRAALEPTRALELMQRLPLAVALLERDGRVAWSNKRFDELFEATTFPAAALPKQFGVGHRTILPGRAGKPVEVLAHFLQAAQFRMLVLDDTPGEVDAATMRALSARLGELERDAMVDRLTGAWSRRYLDHAGAAELARSRRYRQPLSAALLDIDYFKKVNDSFGHQAGDEVLCDLVRVARKCMRTADALVRWGGEEFFILMPYTNHRAAAAAAEKLRSAVEQHPFATVGRVTVSLGVAESLAVEEPDAFFRRLDQALYSAKQEGRNRVVAEARGASDGWDSQEASVVRLVWRDEYLCGEPVIDIQHQELFRLANEVIGASLRKTTTLGVLLSALDRCLAYIARHFAVEEKILEAVGYAKLAEHKAAHRMLLDRAKALRLAAQNDEVDTGTLVQFLAGEVVAQHLLAADLEFFPLFAPAQTVN